MKVNVYSLAGTKKGAVDLPKQFSEPIRKDLIRRAVIAMQSHSYQPYGADPLAGTRQGSPTPKRRRKYRTTYGYGISRIARKFSWHRGTRFGFVGAFVASAVGGRKAFPPHAEKDQREKINVKERRKAIRSALAATCNKTLVELHGHKVRDVKELPLVIEDKLESIKKAKDAEMALKSIGLGAELARTKVKKIRSGKGKMRGRRYKTKVGPLIVVSKACELVRAGKSLPGVDIISVDSLNAEILAPGTEPGRLTVWTETAMQRLEKEALFQ